MSPTRRDILKAAGGVAALLAVPAAAKVAAAPEPIEDPLTPGLMCIGVTIDGKQYSLIDMCGGPAYIAGPRCRRSEDDANKLLLSEPAQKFLKAAGEGLAQMMRIELDELAEQGGAL